jgi:hypothetical protein
MPRTGLIQSREWTVGIRDTGRTISWRPNHRSGLDDGDQLQQAIWLANLETMYLMVAFRCSSDALACSQHNVSAMLEVRSVELCIPDLMLHLHNMM